MKEFKLNDVIKKFIWVYERDYGDRGIVLAETREEAIEKLLEKYPDTRERIAKTEKEEYINSGWMYVLPITNYENIGDIFVTEPW